MKAYIFKYIFFTIAVVLVIISIYIIYNSNSKGAEETVEEKESLIIKNNIIVGTTNYDTINPILTKNKDVQYITKLIFEPLIDINQNFEIEYCLAEECSKIDETTYILKLNEDKHWHDGTAFTAKDVAFTINNLKNDINQSIYKEQIENIKELKIINDYIIKIYLKESMGTFEYMLNFPILASHAYYEETMEAKNNLPIGTGEYKITSIDEKNIRIEKSSGTIEGKIEKINVSIYNTISELYTAFSKGKVDLIITNNINYEEYLGTIGYNVNSNQGREFDYLVINTSKEILSENNIRQAINHAINKQNIIYKVYKNKFNTADFPLLNESYLYNEKINNMYDISKAKDFFSKAKFKGKVIELNLIVNIENENRKIVAKELKEQLKQIGIEINIIETNRKNLQKYIENNNYDLIITGNILSVSPDLTTYFGEKNLSNYYNEEITEILENLKVIEDKGKIKKEYTKIIEIYKEEIPFIGLYFNSNIVLSHYNIKGNMNHNWYNVFYNLKGWYKTE